MLKIECLLTIDCYTDAVHLLQFSDQRERWIESLAPSRCIFMTYKNIEYVFEYS